MSGGGAEGSRAPGGTAGGIGDGTGDDYPRVVREPAEWANFGPEPDQPPAGLRRIAQGVSGGWRVLGHEWTLAALACLALSLLLNRGALVDPAHTLPQDIWDPSLVAYLIAWDGHALLHDPANLWHLNAFFPSSYGLAYTDSLLGYAPLALVGTGAPAAVLRYNIIFILAGALALFGAYALARQLGVGRLGATVAAVGFALAPWRLAQMGHLQVVSSGGIVLSLAMLARGHGVRWRRAGADLGTRPADAPMADRSIKRPGWALAGWLVAAWQLTLGFGIGLVFAYVLLGASVVMALRWLVQRRPLSRRLLAADAGGGLVFAATGVLLAQPYLKVLELYPYARRTVEWVALYSPPPRGYLIAPYESLVWGPLHTGARSELTAPGEMALLPGYILMALAVAGLFFSVWSLGVRLALAAGAAATAVLGLGTNGARHGRLGYVWLLEHLPGFEGLRTPGRLVSWTTLLLALLAAGGVCALAQRAHAVAQQRGLPRPTMAASLALLLPAVLIVVEGLGTTPNARVPPAPAVLGTVEAPYLVLPTDPLLDMNVMLWSTDRFAPVVNGNSGFTPAELDRTRSMVRAFPDPTSVAYLRQLGVRTVVIRPDLSPTGPWQEAATRPIDGLGITRTVVDGTTVFDLWP